MFKPTFNAISGNKKEKREKKKERGSPGPLKPSFSLWKRGFIKEESFIKINKHCWTDWHYPSGEKSKHYQFSS